MKRLIGIIGDRLQALFPPNRVAILLAGPIVAAAAWTSAVITGNIPGVKVPTGIIAGVMGAAVLIVIRLLDRWFDQWQKGEPIDVGGDLDGILDSLAESPEADNLYEALGTMHAVSDALLHLEGKIGNGTVNEAEIAATLSSVNGVVGGLLDKHIAEGGHPEPTVSPAVEVPVDAAEGAVPAGASEGVAPAAPPTE